MLIRIFLALFLFLDFTLHAKNKNAALDPLKAINWNTFFDRFKVEADLCECPIEGSNTIPIGFKISHSEPIMWAFVSNSSIDFFGLGLDNEPNLGHQGKTRPDKSRSFRHVVTIVYPILGWTLGAMQEHVCFEKGSLFGAVYVSSLQPGYNNDILGLMFSSGLPMSRSYLTPISIPAEISCVAEAASVCLTGGNIDELYHCAGSTGSMGATTSGFQRPTSQVASYSRSDVSKVLSIMAQTNLWPKTCESFFSSNPTGTTIQNSRCKNRFSPILLKSCVDLQIAYQESRKIGSCSFMDNFVSDPFDKDKYAVMIWRRSDRCLGATNCNEVSWSLKNE